MNIFRFAGDGSAGACFGPEPGASRRGWYAYGAGCCRAAATKTYPDE